MDKDEALKLALEALKEYCEHGAIFMPITAVEAIEQALAAPVQPVAYWIPKAEQFCIADPSGRPFAKAWEPLYTTPPAAQPAVPDAMTSADIQEHIEYVAGWNDCRAAMMEMMK
jgi:hypothetical protein